MCAYEVTKEALEAAMAIQEAFKGRNEVEILNVGDSIRARRIIEGTDEGRNILYVLEKRGYL